ncbi:K_tetra-domain-containing protein [Chaetoceros tenuissimus]|uniref:K_tetra-domain-containing protein n=1 Tax=Chaetoceros tenuissimus TaxID=426638 RepID=A0AAD3CQZ6_9STRA|nr:K_tetra-domain-containing protein [Chaetoceros tenuissimus]
MFTISKSTTVQFVVGGTPYEVSRSLIENFPDSMLASIVSNKWKENSQEQIFIERDGQRFRYVLDYMRDGKVNLPRGERVESLCTELEYFGIEYDLKLISSNDSLNVPESRNSLRLFLEKHRTLEKEQGEQYKTTMIIVDIIGKALSRFTSSDGSIDFSITYESKGFCARESHIFHFLKFESSANRNEIMARINECILPLNLRIDRIESQYVNGQFKQILALAKAS